LVLALALIFGGAVVVGSTGDREAGKPSTPSGVPAPAAVLEPAYRPETLELVARVVYAECGGIPENGIYAVAQVVQNRHILWNKSVEEVIFQEGQFAPPYEGDLPEVWLDATEEVFLLGVKDFGSNVTHFYNPKKCSPYWAITKEVVGTRGGHIFLY